MKMRRCAACGKRQPLKKLNTYEPKVHDSRGMWRCVPPRPRHAVSRSFMAQKRHAGKRALLMRLDLDGIRRAVQADAQRRFLPIRSLLAGETEAFWGLT